MSSARSFALKNCRTLAASKGTMEDLYRVITADPERILLEDARYVGEWRYCTSARLTETVDRLAAALGARLKVSGRYIGLHGENCMEWIALFWAILKSGNAPYLINLRQPLSLARDCLRDLDGVAVVSVENEIAAGLPCLTYAELSAFSAPPVSVPFGNAFALSTGGTTLQRKICIYDGQAVSAQIGNSPALIRKNPRLVASFRGTMKVLAFLPLYHIFGLEVSYLWFAVLGARLVFPPDRTPERLLRTVRYHDVTHLFAVPLLWASVEKSVLREADRDPEQAKKFQKALDLSLRIQSVCPPLGRWFARKVFGDVQDKLFGDSVRFCITGGSPVRAETLRLLGGLGYRLHNGYGMTEVGITSVELSESDAGQMFESIGRPVPSVRYRVEDERLFIQGTSLCREMIVNGVCTPTPAWFDTGDLVACDKGRYSILGRVSDLVFGEDGENLNPELAEERFDLSLALQFSVLGDEKNERLILVVRISPDLSRDDRLALQNEIAFGCSLLPEAYALREIRYTYDPLSDPNDIKISRARLRRWLAEGKIRTVPLLSDVPAEERCESETRARLREIIGEILSLPPEQIGDHAHFVHDLGGTSLDYFTLLARLDDAFGISLQTETERFGYTVAELEAMMEGRL